MSNEIATGWGECPECRHEHYTRFHGPACPVCDCNEEFTPAPTADQQGERNLATIAIVPDHFMQTPPPPVLKPGTMKSEIAQLWRWHDEAVRKMDLQANRITSLEAELDEARKYKALADEARDILGHYYKGHDLRWSNEDWLARYDALSHPSSTGGGE